VRREALACLASVLIASLSFESVKAADRVKIIYPSISSLVSGLWITKKAKLFVRELEQSGFDRQLHGKLGS
jgi:hypothetical protein